MTGIVDRIVLDRGFGFITMPNSEDVFFHFKALDGIDFDEQLTGRRVEFDFTKGDKGPRATSVRAVE